MVSQLLLELVVLLLSVPVPLVDLLELETSVLGKLLESSFGWLAVGILVNFLKLIDFDLCFSWFSSGRSRQICLLGPS